MVACNWSHSKKLVTDFKREAEPVRGSASFCIYRALSMMFLLPNTLLAREGHSL